jgi:hypothetical protein
VLGDPVVGGEDRVPQLGDALLQRVGELAEKLVDLG